MRYISRNAFRIKNRRGKMRENASYFYRLQDQSVLEMLLVFLEGGTWRQVYVKVISRSSRMRAVLFWGLLQYLYTCFYETDNDSFNVTSRSFY